MYFLIKFGFKTIVQWPLLILDKITNNLFSSAEIINSFNKYINEKFKDKTEKTLDEEIQKMEPTIIIFENLERLENNAFEIIKLIQRISILPNLMIIISINKTKLFSYKMHSVDEEHWIDKYCTLGIEYKFKQSFTNFLINKNIKKEIAELINELLINYDDLNIRYLSNKFHTNKNLTNIEIEKWFKNSKYHCLIYIHNELKLKNLEYIKTIIDSDKQKINNFLIEQKIYE